jgi:hypothetical protein
MSYHGILADVEALEDAIEALPTKCLYHGDKLTGTELGINPYLINPLSNPYDGACCQSGKPALFRRRAEAALQRLRENL